MYEARTCLLELRHLPTAKKIYEPKFASFQLDKIVHNHLFCCVLLSNSNKFQLREIYEQISKIFVHYSRTFPKPNVSEQQVELAHEVLLWIYLFLLVHLFCQESRRLC